MSDLSYMDKLLDGVEIEWKLLAEVGEFQRGKRFVKTDMISEGVPCIHYGEMYTHYGIWAKTSKSFVTKELASKLRVAEYGDVVIVAAGETIEDIGKGTAWLGDTSIVIHDACFSYKSLLNPKYVSYFLKTKIFHDQIKPYISSGKISAINAKGLGKAKIPIPSATIQAEIVRILDTFTELTVDLTIELTTEVTARKQQYTYYREQLLTFEEGEVAWKALGDIATINTGQKPSEVLDVETAYDYINAGTSRSGYSKSSNCEGGVVTTPSRGQGGIGYVGYQSQPFWLGALCYKMNSIDENSLINKYLFYFLQSRSQLLLALKKEGGVPAVNKSDLAKLEIPVPPLVEQQRIVTILDELDAVTTSLTEGLPREIELRQQQYQYYRELLLNFPKNEVASHD